MLIGKCCFLKKTFNRLLSHLEGSEFPVSCGLLAGEDPMSRPLQEVK